MAAAWFNVYAPPEWRATKAGVTPQSTVSAHAPRLLDGTAAADLLDTAPPRPIEAVPEAELVVAIDCPAGSVPFAAVHWRLEHGDFDEAMGEELRTSVAELARRAGSDGRRNGRGIAGCRGGSRC